MSAQVADVLRKALALFGPNGEHWTQLSPSKDVYGTYCAATAISALPSCYTSEARNILCEVIGIYSSQWGELWAWNDADSRTFAEVKAKYEEAIAKAEADTGAAK